MKRFLLLVLSIWLSACASIGRYTKLEPSSYYAIGNTWAFTGPHTRVPLYNVAPQKEVKVVGRKNDWYVINRSGELLLIPAHAIAPTGAGQPVTEDLYYYPHGQVADTSTADEIAFIVFDRCRLYHTIGNTWAYNRQGGQPTHALASGLVVPVRRLSKNWALTITSDGKRLYVPQAALVIGRELTGVAANVYYYPYRQASLYAPGEGPAYSLSTGRETYIGPRGGEYYINGAGNKTYITPESTRDREYIQMGPRGGQYYINGNGRKTYIKN